MNHETSVGSLRGDRLRAERVIAFLRIGRSASPEYAGGTDTIDNMVLQGIDLHISTHRYYRLGGRVPSINPPMVNPY